MKLGLGLDFFWTGPAPPPGVTEQIVEADRLGYDIAFTAETWGADAFTPLAWWGSLTTSIRLGTSVAQMGARTPAATAMAAMALDQLSGGRFVLGLGLSGPQVVEGWYGRPFTPPLARTREYLRIVREVIARERPLTNDGKHFPLPYDGPDSMNVGKPLKSLLHPVRPDAPIFLGAEGPRNVALCAELCDGWLSAYLGASKVEVWRPWLEEGWSRVGARRDRTDFEIIGGMIVLTDDRRAAIDERKELIAWYVGGMGARDHNFHKDLFVRLGYERESRVIQDLYLEGKRREAVAAVPDAMVLDSAVIGGPEEIRDEIPRWTEAGFTTMLVQPRTTKDLQRVAEVVLAM